MTLKIGENITSNTSLDSEKNSFEKFIDRNLPANSELQNQRATANITDRLIENSKGNPNRELTAQDFLQKVLKEQPIKIDDQNKSKIQTVMKPDKKPSEMTRDDYNIAFRREVYRHAMSGLKMSDDEIRMADKALIDAGIYKTYFNLQGTVEDLQNSQTRSGNQMPIKIGNENIEYARRAGQAVLQYREYQSLTADARKDYARRYVNEAFGGFIQPIVNAPVNIGNGLSEPFRAGERAMFGTNYIPEIPRMQVAERSEYWNKDNRMLANRIGEIGATITFGGMTGSRMMATQTGRTILGIESGYNIGAGFSGKDITQQDENGNPRQMSYAERALRITGGFLGARQTIKTELNTPNSAVNRLDDIFKNPPTIKPQVEVVTNEGLSIKIPQPVKPVQTVDDLNSKTASIDSNGNPSGTRFRSDYEDHIKFREIKSSAKNGISGCHNLLEFLKEVGKINIIKITKHPTINGVYKYEYQMPKLDVTGTPIPNQWRAKMFPKTVYDPRKISDSQMAQWGREAYAEAVNSGKVDVTRGEWSGTASNGAKFFGHLDKETGAVRTFFFDF